MAATVRVKNKRKSVLIVLKRDKRYRAETTIIVQLTKISFPGDACVILLRIVGRLRDFAHCSQQPTLIIGYFFVKRTIVVHATRGCSGSTNNFQTN